MPSMADDSSDPHDIPNQTPNQTPKESPTPDPAAFEEMLRSMGVDPAAASKSAEATAAAGNASTPDLSGLGPLGPLMGMLGGQMGSAGGFAWDAARQSALWTAAGGGVEATVDPMDRIRIEEQCQQAAAAVEEVTSLPVVRPGAKLDVQVTTRAGWAAFALEDHRALLERVSAALGSTPTDASPSADPLAGIFAMVGPLLLSSQAGSVIGQLATATLATHDWPIARPGDRLTIVSSSVDAFAAEWSIPISTARLHVCIADVALHSVLRVPHVHLRLTTLMERHADAARFDADAMSEELGRRMRESGESDDSDAGDNPLAALGGLGGLAGTGRPGSWEFRPRSRRSCGQSLVTSTTWLQSWAHDCWATIARLWRRGSVDAHLMLRVRTIEAPGDCSARSLLRLHMNVAQPSSEASYNALEPMVSTPYGPRPRTYRHLPNSTLRVSGWRASDSICRTTENYRTSSSCTMCANSSITERRFSGVSFRPNTRNITLWSSLSSPHATSSGNEGLPPTTR
jgi:uncharacterized protein (DUF2342 family)